MEAAHSVVSVTEAGENIRDSAAIGLSVAGSLATVVSRHILTAANQNRATQFIVSLPLPLLWNRGSLGSGTYLHTFLIAKNMITLEPIPRS
jgi:hypothetical protein